MKWNYKIYLCLFMYLVVASVTQGKTSNDEIVQKKHGKKSDTLPLYKEITNKQSLQLDNSVELGNIIARDGLSMAKIVGEVLEDNVQTTDMGKQDSSLENEHLIQITTATPRRIKKLKNAKKPKHLKSKKSETMKNKKKRKLNKKASKKRKYPKKYNGKKHGNKKINKDKNHSKAKLRQGKRSNKGKSRATKISKST